MTRAGKLRPGRKYKSDIRWKIWKIPSRCLGARRRELLKAGYLEQGVIYGKDYNEISKLDNDMESGLLSLTLKELKGLHLLAGRRNHIKKIMKAYTLSYGDAKIRAVRDFVEWGGTPGQLQDYISYYY